MHFEVNTLDQTNDIAKLLAKHARKNLCILLSGQLGIGKTTLTQQILKNLAVHDHVTSPSFVILNQYSSDKLDFKINHMDCYRLMNQDKEENWLDYIEEFYNNFNIIEWPEIIERHLEKDFDLIKITMEFKDDKIRQIHINDPKNLLK